MTRVNFRINRRAVSPVIATLLLIAIAVAAAVVTYSWVMSMTANQSQQAQTGIKIDQVLFGKSAAASTTISIGTQAAGTTIFPIASTTGFAVGDTISIGTETGKVISAVTTGASVTIGATTADHSNGETVTVTTHAAVSTTVAAPGTTTGATVIPVTTTTGFAVGDTVTIDAEAGRVISAVTPGVSITTDATTADHAAGVTVTVTTHAAVSTTVSVSTVTIGSTTINVASSSGFVVGEVISIDGESRTISAVAAGKLTISTATSVSHATGVAVTVTTSTNGVLVSIRNTGSIASTVQTIYVFKGDGLLATITPSSSNTLSAGSISNLGAINTASSSDWNTLRAGGAALPTASAVTTSVTFNAAFAENTPYRVQIMTTTGFVAEGTYYSPGSF